MCVQEEKRREEKRKEGRKEGREEGRCKGRAMVWSFGDRAKSNGHERISSLAKGNTKRRDRHSLTNQPTNQQLHNNNLLTETTAKVINN
jgi:predicted transposase YdaD